MTKADLTLVGFDLDAARRRVDPRTFAVLCNLVTDREDADGVNFRWDRASSNWHVAFALMTLDPGGTPLRYISAPKSAAKTAVSGACLLAQMVSGEMPAGAHSYVYSRDAEQSRLTRASMSSFVQLTPGLHPLVDVQSRRIVSKETGAQVIFEAADPSGAHGTRPWATLLDEVHGWPETESAKRVYEIAMSGVAKLPNSRLVAISTKGDPTHWSKHIYDEAMANEGSWSAIEMFGPTPGLDADRLAAVKASLSPSVWGQLYENQWVASEDAALDGELVEAVFDAERPEGEGRPVITVDLGVRKDSTAITVAHLVRQGPADPTGVVVVDETRVWAPTPTRPVDLTEVEAELEALIVKHRPSAVRIDAHQALSMAQRLAAKFGAGIVKAVHLTPSLQTEIATAIISRVNGGTLRAEDRNGLRSELHRLRFKERAGNLAWTKSGGANDLSWTVAYACHLLQAKRTGRVVSAGALPRIVG